MIELTDEQRKAAQTHPGGVLRLVDPTTQEVFVLLRAEEYERLQDYDASPWTDEEMDRLAAADADSLGWEGMESYQDSEA